MSMEDFARGSPGGVDGASRGSIYAGPVPEEELEIFPDEELEIVIPHPAGPEVEKVESRSRIDQQQQPPKQRRIIEKVPWLLRRDKKNKGNYNPKMVSIGPYHHGKKKLQTAEKIKPRVAQLFVSDSGRDLSEFRGKVLEKVYDARSCYVDGSTDKYSDDEFADMMLHDGCFVLGLTEMMTTSGKEERERYWEEILCLGVHSEIILCTDVYSLLENQLPFLVLELLMCLKTKKQGDEQEQEQEQEQRMKIIDNLLEALYSWDIRPGLKKKVGNGSEIMQALHLLEYFWLWENDNQPRDVLEYQRREKRMEKKSNLKELFYTFRPVTELKAKRIYVRPSSSHYNKDIKFISFSFYGLLELPPLIVSPYNNIYCSNVIAYEWRPDNRNCLAVTAYVNFMKSLINHPDDVKAALK